MIIPSAKSKVIKVKRCKAPGCDNDFMPLRPLQRACSPGCALSIVAHANAKKALAVAKLDRKETKAKLEAMKPRRYWIAQAKKAMHGYVRARDEGRPCISCDTPLINTGKPGGDYDAGHYRSVGSAKHLEFELININGQCKHCNDFLGGNHAHYRRGLIARIGIAAVESLEADQRVRKLTVDDLKTIKNTYNQKARELQKHVE